MTPPKSKLRERHVNLLLLSIIRAYDHPDRKSEEERLAIAKNALFGTKRRRGRASAFDDLALFQVLAELRKKEMEGLGRALANLDPKRKTAEWEAEIARDPMNVKDAARICADLAKQSENVADDAVIDRLRRKVRKPLKDREMAEIAGLFDPEEPRTRTIIRILELLKNLDVQSETIWDKDT